MEELKHQEQTESSVLGPRQGAAGGSGFLCSGREHAGVQDLVDYTIWVTGGLFICAV